MIKTRVFFPLIFMEWICTTHLIWSEPPRSHDHTVAFRRFFCVFSFSEILDFAHDSFLGEKRFTISEASTGIFPSWNTWQKKHVQRTIKFKFHLDSILSISEEHRCLVYSGNYEEPELVKPRSRHWYLLWFYHPKKNRSSIKRWLQLSHEKKHRPYLSIESWILVV